MDPFQHLIVVEFKIMMLSEHSFLMASFHENYTVTCNDRHVVLHIECGPEFKCQSRD
jgi:hypothetical protein